MMKNQIFPTSVPIKGRVRICLKLLKAQNLRRKIIVDVGCSFGWLEREIENAGAKQIIGIDPSKRAVAFARKVTKNASFLVGDARRLPLKSNLADIVVFYDIIEHLPKGEERRTLAEIARVLKRGGVLLLSTPNKNVFSNIFDLAWYFGHRHYSPDEIKKMLSESGFKIFDISVLGSVFSSFYLSWFYVAKRILGTQQPRSKFLEELDDRGYDREGITNIFVVARKI